MFVLALQRAAFMLQEAKGVWGRPRQWGQLVGGGQALLLKGARGFRAAKLTGTRSTCVGLRWVSA